ncbi:MAG: rRNA maturation RNase YbeY, partial [Spirochaetales bacterium]|nr:rRNA maturation RNase YbeY [Spirochaetales bacterium]
MYYIEFEECSSVDEKLVKDTLELYLNYLKEKRDFSLHFIDDEEMQSLNYEYRGIDSPTDILTFAINDGDDFPILFDDDEIVEEEEELGDVFISIESMHRNALEFGVSDEEELKRLLLHGLLHLRGMDHITNDFATEPMLIEQERILSV